jgi:hypothetical protein
MPRKVKRRTRTAPKRRRSARRRLLASDGSVTIMMPSNPTVDGDLAAEVLASYATDDVTAYETRTWHEWASDVLRKAVGKRCAGLPEGDPKRAKCQENLDHIQRWD